MSLDYRICPFISGVGDIDKARVKRSFSRAARTYDEHAGFQTLMAKRLMELVPQDERFRRVLDIGCATGGLAMDLSALLPAARVFACDISGAMLLRAREKSLASNAGRLDFIVSDFEALPFKDASIDLLASNLAYQWAGNLKESFKELYRVLAPGGLVLMSTLARGTLGELRESFREAEASLDRPYKHPFMDFAEPDVLKACVSDSGLKLASFDELSFTREYPSMRELLRVLKNIGAVNPLSRGGGAAATASLLKAADDYYRSRFPAEAPGGAVRARYNTVFIVAKKAV